MFPFSKVIDVCWVVFWVYWLIAAFDSKKNTKPTIKRYSGVRLIVFALVIVFFRFINVQNHSFQNRLTSKNESVLVAGLIVFILGLMLAIWARLYIGKNWGMPMTQKQNPELVTTGPYQYIRHPIYSGILLAMLGSAMASNIFWLTILLISGLYFIYSATAEERLMMKQFPKNYPDYKSNTKMYIPFIL